MNPELQRNVWLEATPQRLVLVPAVLFSAAALIAAVDPTGLAVQKMALFGFVLITTVWGARQAANSVLDEARERTWDVQRMCALPAWSMTWGKLAGATLLSWYGGLCCVVLLAGKLGPGEQHGAWLTVLFATCAALIAQAGALIAALVGMHRGRAVQARLGNLLVVVLLLVVMPRVANITDSDEFVRWYGHDLHLLPFATLAAASFAGWALLGASRAMAIELQIVHRPTAWLGFIAFCAVFGAGFFDLAASPPTRVAAALCAALALAAGAAAYAAAFAYPSDAVQLRRMLQAWRAGGARLAQETPLWIVAAGVALGAALASTVLGAAPTVGALHVAHLGVSLIALGCMLLRDLLLLTWLVMVSRPGQAEGLALVYLVLLDGLLPALLPHLGLGVVATLLRPDAFAAPYSATALFGVQALLAAALCWSAYRRQQARLNETIGG